MTGPDQRPKSPAERLGLLGPKRAKAEKCLANAVYFEARSELYILRSKVHDSALFSNNANFRETWVQHARSLVETYAEGYEGWLEAQKENVRHG